MDEEARPLGQGCLNRVNSDFWGFFLALPLLLFYVYSRVISHSGTACGWS
jgi:hypothetical protein